jgi:uncharacterized iron-regulated membrane protein
LRADPIAPGDRQPQEVPEMRSSQHIKTGLAVTLMLGAIAAPAASAHGAQAGWIVRPNPDGQATQLARAAATRQAQNTWIVRPNPDEQNPSPAPVTIVRLTDAGGGFDWGDAGIGAAGALGLILAATGATLLIARRRHYPHTRTNIRTAS